MYIINVRERCVSPRWRDTAERYGYHLVITPYLHFPFRRRTWQSERKQNEEREREREREREKGRKKRKSPMTIKGRRMREAKPKRNQRDGSVDRKPEEREIKNSFDI